MESQSGVHYDTYTTSMYRFKLEVQGKTDDEIILRTELTHYVTFTYSTKVKRISGDFEAYHRGPLQIFMLRRQLVCCMSLRYKELLM